MGNRHKQIQDKGLCIDIGITLNIGGDMQQVKWTKIHVDSV